MRKWILGIFAALSVSLSTKAQDTTRPWFPGGDDGFYRYLEDRFFALLIERPEIGPNGETVLFEFYITDSGNVDSIKVQQCFNFQLCYYLRQILATMPKVNAPVFNGKLQPERRVYYLSFRRFGDGYVINPAPGTPYTEGTPTSKMKWLIAVAAVVAMLIVIFR